VSEHDSFHRTYGLPNYKESIKEASPDEVIQNPALLDYVCSAAIKFLTVLQETLDSNEAFSDTFLERTNQGCLVFIRQHLEQQVPFSRFNEDASYPHVELYLPKLGENPPIDNIIMQCGSDLVEAFIGTNKLDPLNNPHLQGGDYLPQVKELPRPALALNEGPIYVRVMETLSEASKESFLMEGPHTVLKLVEDYICKHAKGRYRMDFSCWLRNHRLGEGAYVLQVSDTDSQNYMSPLIIVNLLENHLGFHRVGEPVAVSGKLVWMFERAKPFKLR
jgi:hypothetical protein